MGRMGRIAGVVLLLVAHAAFGQTAAADGFASREAIVAEFVAALEANDRDRLMGLLIDRDRYRDVIVPGSVAPGQPRRDWPEKTRQFFTDTFFEKSGHYADVLLKDWGGRRLTVKAVRFTREPKTYATYTAYGELRIDVDSEPAVDHEPVIRTGFLAEVDGRFRFLGFLHDDD